MTDGKLPRYRGTVFPAKPPPNGKRCGWGSCEAGGWILEHGPRVTDAAGVSYHPGCYAAMEFANRRCSLPLALTDAKLGASVQEVDPCRT